MTRIPDSSIIPGTFLTHGVCDATRNEWQLHQMPCNCPSFQRYDTSETENQSQGRQQEPYWKRVHNERDLAFLSPGESTQKRIDEYWEEAANITDETGKT